MRRIIAIAAALTAAAVSPAPAQTPPAAAELQALAALTKDVTGQTARIDEELKRVSGAMLDLSVPDSPAFTVLGLSPEEIGRPTTARRLATSLLNGVDRHGVLQSGIAVDAVPYLAIFGDQVRLEQYRDLPADPVTGRSRNNYATRFVARTQLSVATAKASSADDSAVRAAVGFRFTLFDFGDPRTDEGLEGCYTNNLPPLPAPPKVITPAAPVNETLEEREKREASILAAEKTRLADAERYLTRLATAAARCRDEAKKETWNDSKWLVAVAPAGKSDSGALGDLRRDGYGVWTTLAYGFEGVPGIENSMQLLLQARVRDNEQVVEPADDTKRLSTDSRMFGLQLRGGGPDSSLAFEALFDRRKPKGGVERTDRRMSVAYERRLAPNLWLGLAVGGGGKKADGNEAGSFLLSSLKWGFAEGRALTAAPGTN